MRDHFRVLYAATAGYASQLWVGELTAEPKTRFTTPCLPTPQRLCISPIRHCPSPYVSYLHAHSSPSKIDPVPIDRSPSLHLTLRHLACCLKSRDTLYRYWRQLLMT